MTAEDLQALRRRFEAATADLDPPFAVVDLQALRANLGDLARRAGGTPIRVASKSVRCRAVLAMAATTPGFRGVMSYALDEALWLAGSDAGEGSGETDVLMGYPSVDRGALRRLATDEQAAARVTLMVDDLAQVDLLNAVVPPTDPQRRQVRVCLDVDASLRIGPVHLGVRRSPLRTPQDVAALAAALEARPGVAVRGVMFYEAQVAGLPDTGPAVRWVKSRSLAELAHRRGAVVAAVRRAVGREPEVVNGGGSGSVQDTVRDMCLTEVTAGSGLFVPTLFDRYRSFTPRPAAWFALPVLRRPTPTVRTLFGGGYVASGPAAGTRLPRPFLPAGLTLLGQEGAGEVQTPVKGRSAAGLQIGDRVWFRHAKAGELCERFDRLHLVEGDQVVEVAPTYRGEGRTFG